MHNIDELKQCLLHVWHSIDHAIEEWHGHLCARVRAKVDTSSNCCDNISHMTRDVSVFVKCDVMWSNAVDESGEVYGR